MDTKEINVKAFLKLIRFAEHGREDGDVYYLLYGGKQTFTDIRKHPNKKIAAWGMTSTAAGAYQILFRTWDEARSKGVVFDFSPASQDKLAVWKIKSRGALDFVEAGDVENAVAKLRNEWASLPGASQSHMKMGEARQRFEKYVKELNEQ